MKRRLLLSTAVVGITAGLSVVGDASAQSYPEKTIRIVSPFPPGGANDIIARLIIMPAELPIGIITAIIGAPVFIWILLNQQRKGAAGFYG